MNVNVEQCKHTLFNRNRLSRSLFAGVIGLLLAIFCSGQKAMAQYQQNPQELVQGGTQLGGTIINQPTTDLNDLSVNDNQSGISSYYPGGTFWLTGYYDFGSHPQVVTSIEYHASFYNNGTVTYYIYGSNSSTFSASSPGTGAVYAYVVGTLPNSPTGPWQTSGTVLTHITTACRYWAIYAVGQGASGSYPAITDFRLYNSTGTEVDLPGLAANPGSSFAVPAGDELPATIDLGYGPIGSSGISGLGPGGATVHFNLPGSWTASIAASTNVSGYGVGGYAYSGGVLHGITFPYNLLYGPSFYYGMTGPTPIPSGTLTFTITATPGAGAPGWCSGPWVYYETINQL